MSHALRTASTEETAMSFTLKTSLATCLALLLAFGTVSAQQDSAEDDAAAPESAATADQDPVERLTQEQQQLLARYKRFEDVLLRLAEVTVGEDPDRAALLRKAIAQSKNRLIALQLERVVDLLEQDQLATAITNQGEVVEDLKKLLELLLSEDRAKKLEAEKERLKAYLKEVNQLIKNQRSLQLQTGRQGDLDRLAEQQGELGERTEKLAETMRSGDQGEAPDERRSPGKPEDGEESESAPPGEGEPSESQEGESSDSQQGESQEGQPQQAEPQDGESGEQQDSQPQEGEQQEQGQPEQQDTSPARQRVEAARQRMREAQEKLEQAQREDATDRQEEALEELEQAKAELEEVLRQLREEEMQRMLVMLEARFRRMLDMQLEVYEGTVRLTELPEEARSRGSQIEAARLGRKESLIVLEADKALELLREDGSAVAFPEAVMQMREDMQQIADRLSEAKVDPLTVGIEEDVIAALEEMIEALKKAQQDLEQSQGQPAPPGAPQEPPLVDQLSELKMIRSLQMRVNRRTQHYAKLVDEAGAAEKPELLEALEALAEREASIYRATRDIVVGRNQ